MVYRDRGWEMVNVDYARGAQGVRDVVDFFDQARRRFPALPFCAVGISAGGHLALMLAALRPSLRCAASLAGPTDLVALPQEPGGAALYKLAVQQFGVDELPRLSPALLARRIRAKLLLMYASNDPVVPGSQGQDMAHAKPSANLLILPPGPAGFIHSNVTSAASTSVVPTVVQFIAGEFSSAGSVRP